MVTEEFLLGRVTLHQNLLPGQRLSLSWRFELWFSTLYKRGWLVCWNQRGWLPKHLYSIQVVALNSCKIKCLDYTAMKPCMVFSKRSWNGCDITRRCRLSKSFFFNDLLCKTFDFTSKGTQTNLANIPCYPIVVLDSILIRPKIEM